MGAFETSTLTICICMIGCTIAIIASMQSLRTTKQPDATSERDPQ